VSSDGEIFDPEIHATDRDGNPSTNRDGSFRKKRKDAGKRASASAEPRPASAAGKVRADQHTGYYKAVAGILQTPATLLSLVDPVDGYCAAQLVDPWSRVIADLAMEYPQVAAAIEKAAVIGPLSGVIGVGLLTVTQYAHNHGKLPAHLAQMVGARPRTEIEQLLKQRGAQLAAEAEEQRRQDEEERRLAQQYAEQAEAERAARAAGQSVGVAHEYADAV
jgi:hypothetical protein